jgi:hypothetical protein
LRGRFFSANLIYRYPRIGFICIIVCGALVWAAQGPPAPAEEPASPALDAAKPPAAAQADATAVPTGRVQAAALLNESRWAVELHRMFTKQVEPPLGDTLTFSDGKLASERLGPLGYAPGTFTLSIGPTGAPVWESTQLSRQDGIVLWRGELNRDTIRGTISRLPLTGASEDFRFDGKEILAAQPVPQPSAAAPPAAPAPAEADSSAPGEPPPAGASGESSPGSSG